MVKYHRNPWEEDPWEEGWSPWRDGNDESWEDQSSKEDRSEFFEENQNVAIRNEMATTSGWESLIDAVDAGNAGFPEIMARHLASALIWLRGFYVYPGEDETLEHANAEYQSRLDKLSEAILFAEFGDIATANQRVMQTAKILLHYGQGHGSKGTVKRLSQALGIRDLRF